MDKKNIKEIVRKIIAVVVSSFVAAVAIKIIVQQNQFLSGGVSGVAVLISRYTAMHLNKAEIESLLYSVIYLGLNIPVFVFGFKKVGKQFVIYSLVNVLCFSALVSLIPSSWYSIFQFESVDKLTLAILAGLLSGAAAVVAFANGFSQGGTDIISMYLSRAKGKGIGSYNLIINAFVLFVGGIMFKDYVSLIYTIIYSFVGNLVINNLYIGHKKVLIEVITNKAIELTEKLMQESHHGCTLINAVGAYSKENKTLLRIVVSSNQTKRICEMIKQIDENSFTTLINISQVNGKFYIPPLK